MNDKSSYKELFSYQRYAIKIQEMKSGTMTICNVRFLPITWQKRPAGMAPTNAPNVTNDPTHDPWDGVNPKLFSNTGMAEDVHENTIPRHTAERVSVIQLVKLPLKTSKLHDKMTYDVVKRVKRL